MRQLAFLSAGVKQHITDSEHSMALSVIYELAIYKFIGPVHRKPWFIECAKYLGLDSSVPSFSLFSFC